MVWGSPRDSIPYYLPPGDWSWLSNRSCLFLFTFDRASARSASSTSEETSSSMAAAWLGAAPIISSLAVFAEACVVGLGVGSSRRSLSGVFGSSGAAAGAAPGGDSAAGAGPAVLGAAAFDVCRATAAGTDASMIGAVFAPRGSSGGTFVGALNAVGIGFAGTCSGARAGRFDANTASRLTAAGPPPPVLPPPCGGGAGRSGFGGIISLSTLVGPETALAGASAGPGWAPQTFLRIMLLLRAP